MKKYRLKYAGLNCVGFLNFLVKNNIEIYDVCESNREVNFLIDGYNYKKLKSKKNPFKLKIVKSGGIKNVINIILKRVGIVVGVILIIASQLVIGDKILYIKVQGSTNSEKVKDVIYDYGIRNVSTLNKEALEKYLLDNINNLSLVSVKTSGNAVIVNVMEKETISKEYDNFYSSYNMVVKQIVLISGTSCVKENDVVKKGDILVEAYSISSNGERISVPAKAKITADVWFCGSESVDKELITYEKTNNKKVYTNISFLKKRNITTVSPYSNFVTETHNINITNNYFLPIFLNEIIFYETQKNVKYFDFEESKNEYFEKSKEKAYDILPNNVIIDETIQNVTELEDRYVFQTYLKSTMEIVNEN